jgi:apolipoprotein N-acyltransferase
MMVFFIGLPLLLLPAALIRPHGYKIEKTRGVILVLIFSVMVISGIMAYCVDVKPSIDDALCILLPIWLRLMLGCGFVAAAVVMLSKLLQDLSIS